jgi:hypothetical protein
MDITLTIIITAAAITVMDITHTIIIAQETVTCTITVMEFNPGQGLLHNLRAETGRALARYLQVEIDQVPAAQAQGHCRQVETDPVPEVRAQGHCRRAETAGAPEQEM